MAITGDFKGTSRNKFQVERDGVVLKNSDGNLAIRNSADTDYALAYAATPAPGDDSNQVATTAFVQANGGVGGTTSYSTIIALG